MIFKSKILNNSIYLIAGETISKVLRFFLVVYLARLTGVSDFGKYGFALSFGGILMILADFGVTPFITREISRDLSRTTTLFSTAIWAKLMLMVACLGITGAAVLVMPKDALTKWVVFIITFSLTVNVLSNTMRAVFHGHQNMADDAKATIFLSVILTLLGFAVLKAGYGLITFAAVHLVASIMEFFYILVLYRKYGKLLFRFRISEIKQILSQSFAFGFQSFFATAYYLLDSNMLAFMKGDEAVGYYNAAYRFITILTFIAIAIARSFYPAISNAHVHAPRDLPDLFSKGFRITLWTGLTLAVGSHLWAKPIILKTFGESFSPSILPLQILGWVLVFLFINNYFGSVLRAMEQQNYTAKTTSFAFLINFVLNLLIIPGYGFNGAAVTALVTEIFVTVMYLRVIHTEGLLKTINPLMVIKTLISSGFMAAVRILPESLWIVQIPAALMLNGAVTLLLRLFSKEELRGLFGLQNRFLKGSS